MNKNFQFWYMILEFWAVVSVTMVIGTILFGIVAMGVTLGIGFMLTMTAIILHNLGYTLKVWYLVIFYAVDLCVAAYFVTSIA